MPSSTATASRLRLNRGYSEAKIAPRKVKNRKKASHSPWFSIYGDTAKTTARKTAKAANIEFRNVRVRVAPINIPSNVNAHEETIGIAIDQAI